MRENTVKETVKKDFCINCGLCEFICPNNAISLKFNKYLEKTPIINSKKCTNCSLCLNICPNSPQKMKTEALACRDSLNEKIYGTNGDLYLAWNSNDEERSKSASGGAISKLAEYLLETKTIAGVIHVERIEAKRKEPHYRACLSTSLEELKRDERKNSAYQPIDFSEVLKSIDKNSTYLITGTPCVIRGINKLKEQGYKFITSSLICSHNTNMSLLDFIADLLGIENVPYFINTRNKDDLLNADLFNNHFYCKDKDLAKKPHFLTGWGKFWRNNYFAMNACLYCSDFWGREADISVKDAWGKWSKEDALGKSLVIIRDAKIKKLFLNCGLETEILDKLFLETHQQNVTIYKQQNAYSKNFKPFYYYRNIKNKHFKNVIISKLSKVFYKTFGSKLTAKLMNIVEFILGAI